MSRKLDASTRTAIEALIHLPQREIARRLKLSIGVVNKVLSEAKERGSKTRSKDPPPAPAAPVPAAAAPVPSHHEEARRRYALANSPEEARATAVVVRRLEDPVFDAALDRGASVAAALEETDIVIFDLLRTPEDIAHLARFAGDFFGCYERERGETEAAFEAVLAEARAESHGRAVTLLEDALALLRAQGVEGQKYP